ncbi:MAG: glycosyltransferase [Opitutaceae bacterium]|nr:glycosyltransferase [Opitutaceae bacterium]
MPPDRIPAISRAHPPALAGGRPRRALFVLASLEPTDAAYRAIDLAVHLKATLRWAVRLLAHAEGPLLPACRDAGVEVQRVDARPLLRADTSEALAGASCALQREVWWAHLDIVAIFEPECAWALDAARSRGIATVADFSRRLDATPYPPVVVAQMQSAVHAVDRVCCTAPAVAATAATGQPVAIIPPWPGAADAVAFPWPAAEDTVMRRAHELLAALEPGVTSVPAYRLNLSRDCPMLGPLLDAALAARPIISIASPFVADFFRPHEVVFLVNGEPATLAHALLDLANNPAAAARRVEAARRRVLGMPDRAALRDRWLAWLEGAVRQDRAPATPARPRPAWWRLS